LIKLRIYALLRPDSYKKCKWGLDMISAIINTPEPMAKVRLATPRDSIQPTLESLQEAGVVHVEEAKALDPVEERAIEKEFQLVRDALTSIDGIIEHLSAPREVRLSESLASRSFSQIISGVKTVHEKFSAIHRQYEEITQEIVSRRELGKHLSLLSGTIDMPLAELAYAGPYLFTNVVVLPPGAQEIFLKNAGHLLFHETTVEASDETLIYFIARTGDRDKIETIISESGAEVLPLEPEEMGLREFLSNNSLKIEMLEIEYNQIQQKIQDVVVSNLEQLVLSREVLQSHQERLSVMSLVCEARYVSVIEGWVPQGKLDEFERYLGEPYMLLEKSFPEEEDEPPTELKNPAAIRPFQVIVNLFSIPKYGDWDPTPIVAYFFAFFFGLMLNDTVYAIGLLLTAKLFLDKLVDDPESPGVNLFRNVLYISGSVALIFGLLSGIFLGDFLHKYFNVDLESLALVAGVQEKLSDPITFIVISLLIGMVHVNIAHILSLIRGIHEGNIGLIVSKIGLFISEVFGIPYIFWALLNIKMLPLEAQVYAVFVYPLAIGVAIIVISSFMQMGYLGALFWIFDLTGFLGDIMSYSRLAGVGLATYYLASSFNLLAEWFSSILASLIPGIAGFIISIIVGTILLVVLHTFNMLLSSLAAFIHSLRLCFVEFLMKFYEGGGREYTPFVAQHRKKVVVGTRS